MTNATTSCPAERATVFEKTSHDLNQEVDWGTELGDLLQEKLDSMQFQMSVRLVEHEVEQLCGAPWEHDEIHGGRYRRWGTNPSSIRVRGERLKYRVPRVQDTKTNKAHPLKSHKDLQKISEQQQKRITRCILLGLSQRRYGELVREFAESFGLSASTISRIFVQQSAKILQEYEQRDLSEDTYVAVVLDGTKIQNCNVVMCVGITEEGTKTSLGFIETDTENATSVEELLRDLVERGLQYEQGLLWIMDGAKGFHKAVKTVFGEYAQIQRCTWHKQENVLRHINDSDDQETVKRRLQTAYNQSTYEQAKQELMELHEELETSAPKAANSLREGLEETLTLHRLGVVELRKSLQTSNIMENINRCLKRHLGKITRWGNSDHCYRWVATAVVDLEPRLKKISQAEYLPNLQQALQKCVPKQKQDRSKIPKFN